MITQSPIPSETSTQQIQPADPSALENSNTPDLVKQALLKFFIGREIRQNDNLQIVTSVSIHDLQTNRYLTEHAQDTEHFAASVNKVPVTMLVLEDLRAGNVTMDTVLHWQASDRRDGAGVFDAEGSPLEAPLKDVLFDMLNRSGNTAARILVNKVLGGSYAVNARLSAAGLVHTYLIPVDADRFYFGNTSSKESLWTLETVLSNQDTYGQFVKNALVTNIYEDFGVKANPLSPFIVLANKIGQLDDPEGDNRHDVGVIYNTKTHKMYGYSFLTTSPNVNPDARLRAEESLEKMGFYTLRYAGNRATESTSLRTLQQPPVEKRMLY